MNPDEVVRALKDAAESAQEVANRDGAAQVLVDPQAGAIAEQTAKAAAASQLAAETGVWGVEALGPWILAGIGLLVLGAAALVGYAIYVGHYGGTSKQIDAAVQASRDPNSDETLRSMREANAQESSGSRKEPVSTVPTGAGLHPTVSLTRSLANYFDHGPTNPSLYSLVVGTWEGTYCGLAIATLRLAATGSVLNGTVSSRQFKENQACDPTEGDICTGQSPATCEYLAPQLLSDASHTSSLGSSGFDGHILWSSVSASAGVPEVQLLYSSGELIKASDRQEPPTIFRRVP